MPARPVGNVARRRALPLLLMLAVTAPLPAQVVIYRCTDAAGAVTLQNNTPCPAGSKQVRRVMEAAAQAPIPPEFVPAKAAPVAVAPTPDVPPIAAPTPDVPPIAAPEPAPPRASKDAALAPRRPPPPLFACSTWERIHYFSEDGQPPQRCVPVQVMGLDGTNATAAGTACQMVDDECQPVAEAALCDSWKQRLIEARSQTVGGDAGQDGRAQLDQERLRRILAESNCTPM